MRTYILNYTKKITQDQGTSFMHVVAEENVVQALATKASNMLECFPSIAHVYPLKKCNFFVYFLE